MTDTLISTLTAMLTDPFRIALLFALVLTQRNTAAVTGRALPLALGVVFVAVILPMTTLRGAPMLELVAYGLVANFLLLIPILVGFALWDRRRR
jgi:hypothetical protein